MSKFSKLLLIIFTFIFIFICLLIFSCLTAFDIFLINELKANLLSCWFRGLFGISSKLLLLFLILSPLLFSSFFIIRLFKTFIIFFEISAKLSLSSSFIDLLIASMIFLGIFSLKIFSSFVICSYKKFKMFVLYSSSSSMHIFSIKGK